MDLVHSGKLWNMEKLRLERNSVSHLIQSSAPSRADFGVTSHYSTLLPAQSLKFLRMITPHQTDDEILLTRMRFHEFTKKTRIK